LHVGSVSLAKLAVATPRRIQHSGSWEEAIPVDIEPVLRAAASASRVAPDEKICPDCGESVKAAARVCRFCRYDFGTDEPGLASRPEN
jgi:tRNA(Ile2) C34 agmatinyltransferase TiaS